MHQGQLAGPIALTDPSTGQPLQASAQGTFTFMVHGDPGAALPHVQAALLGATSRVLRQKLAQNQVAIPTLAQSLPYFVQEIVAQSGVAQMGVQIGQLQLAVQVQQQAVAGYAGPLPPDPQTQLANRMQDLAKERLDPRNYEYSAQVNVGGFKLKASTDGGFDTDGLANQAVGKAKNELVWWGIGCAVVGLVVVLLGGIGWYAYAKYKATTVPPSATGKPAEDAEKSSWDGKSPFSCGGDDHVRIEGVTAKLDKDTVISASGACQVDLVNCDLTGKIGIQTLANAQVRVKGGKVTGKDAAAKALGNSRIVFDGTTVTGKKDGLGAAKVEGP